MNVKEKLKDAWLDLGGRRILLVLLALAVAFVLFKYGSITDDLRVILWTAAVACFSVSGSINYYDKNSKWIERLVLASIVLGAIAVSGEGNGQGP